MKLARPDTARTARIVRGERQHEYFVRGKIRARVHLHDIGLPAWLAQWDQQNATAG